MWSGGYTVTYAVLRSEFSSSFHYLLQMGLFCFPDNLPDVSGRFPDEFWPYMSSWDFPFDDLSSLKSL